ncbi:unnamed protein product [Ranitomeya imitator]|uniref:Tyr recombinase domain-containing protein n=1 Tax=Ranitomeya imitator TaxID=111125 RepID=A0ABN9KZP4_9NEOB|nr:unnamed protein product [Ranitomeya imitator]
MISARLDSGLAPSTLKRQVSALSVLFQRRIAPNRQVRTFFQGVAHEVPPYKTPLEAWDLNLVLRALQDAPFEPLQEVSLMFLSWKVVFLVAITSIRRVSELAALSCRPPFLRFHQDKVVLRPAPSFLPKVVSSFHINEDIVLPSFCPAPTHRVEKALHTLDLGRRKGCAASKSTLARWIRATIQEAYRSMGMTVPAGIKAHSTRAVGASWAVRHQASAEQCQPPGGRSIHPQSCVPHSPVSPNERLGEKDFTLNSAQLSHLTVNLGNAQDENQRNQLPDFIQNENGVCLTALGRQQIINGLRKFDLQYYGDPELQPIRSYENATLVRFLYQLSSVLNERFGSTLASLCRRQDFLGKFCSYHLSSKPIGRMSPMPSSNTYDPTVPRIRLRFFANYRVLMYLLLFYFVCCGLSSMGPVSCTLFLLFVYVLYAAVMTFITEHRRPHQD